ncbi:MAG TPA: metal-dependent hydrolase [Thermomicrobiales bacterium]|nr:metal-dependent hydrolase [Thermomicrobiales bacterium]
MHERRGLAAAFGFGLTALSFDILCDYCKRHDFKHQEALSDGAAHIATALAVTVPASPFVKNPRRFVATAVASAVAIDLDHVIAARSTQLIPCMTMPNRPASHSVVTVGLVSYLAERVWPGTQTDLGIVLGLGSHLLRDLATGGAPLFIPKRIVAIERPPVAVMMVTLGFFGRWYARHMLNPQRKRRSNQKVLAPQAFITGSRALRARRALSAVDRPSRAA